jgi:hypothetical protein
MKQSNCLMNIKKQCGDGMKRMGNNMSLDLEKIERLAREARLPACHTSHPVALTRFANLVAAVEREACEDLWKQLDIKDEQIRAVIEASIAVEREACAQIAQQWDKEHPSTNFGGCIARSIRARSNHEQG